MFDFLKKSGNQVILDYYETRKKLHQVNSDINSLTQKLSKAVEGLMRIGSHNLDKSSSAKLHRQLTELSKEVYNQKEEANSQLEELNKSLTKQLSDNDYLYQLPLHIEDLMMEKDYIKSVNKLNKSLSKELDNQDLRSQAKKLLEMEPLVICGDKENFNVMIKRGLVKSQFADAIISNSEGKIFFVKRPNDANLFPGKWGLPGGHVEQGEDVVKAALRELKEETNIDSDSGNLLLNVKDGEADLNYIAVRVKDYDLPIVILDADETVNYTYANFDEIENLDTIPGLKENLAMIFEEPLIKGIDKSKLVRKLITVNANGKTYQTTKWVSRETGESEFAVTQKETQPFHLQPSEFINHVLNGGENTSQQLRSLINYGIYNKKMLIGLTGCDAAQAYSVLKEADLLDLSKEDSHKSHEEFTLDGENVKYNDDQFDNTKRVERKSEEEIDIFSLDKMIEAELSELMASGEFDFADSQAVNPYTGKDSVDTTMDLFVNMVVKKQRKLAILYGMGGVGKTYQTKQVLTNPNTIGPDGQPFGNDMIEYDPELDPSKDEYDFVKITGKITQKKLYETLYEHNGKVIMFDDADSIFDDENAINILKGALDTTLETISYKASTPKVDDVAIPTSMKFRGSVIIISNLSEKTMRSKGAGPLLDSRALAVDTSRTMEETVEKLDRIKDRMPFEDAQGNEIQVSHSARVAAINFIKKYSKYLPLERVNGRKLGELALLFESSGLDNPDKLTGYYPAQTSMGVTRDKIADTMLKRKLEDIENTKKNEIINKKLSDHLNIMKNVR